MKARIKKRGKTINLLIKYILIKKRECTEENSSTVLSCGSVNFVEQGGHDGCL